MAREAAEALEWVVTPVEYASIKPLSLADWTLAGVYCVCLGGVCVCASVCVCVCVCVYYVCVCVCVYCVCVCVCVCRP